MFVEHDGLILTAVFRASHLRDCLLIHAKVATDDISELLVAPCTPFRNRAVGNVFGGSS